MTTPAFSRQQGYSQKRKDKRAAVVARRPLWKTLRCGNPACRWVYKFTASSYERGLLESVWDVSDLQCCDEARVSHFCPSADDVARRAAQIKLELHRLVDAEPNRVDEVKRRVASVDRHAVRLKRYAGAGCWLKLREFRAKVAEARALLQQRQLYARLHHATLESEFPPELQLASYSHLQDVLQSSVAGVQIHGMFRHVLNHAFRDDDDDVDGRSEEENSCSDRHSSDGDGSCGSYQ